MPLQTRFESPTKQVTAPSPDIYSPKQQLGSDVKSNHVRVPRAPFNRNKFDILDMQFSMQRAKENPAPGEHERFSEFHSLPLPER